MYKLVLALVVLMLLMEGAVTAQDPQFSQFYAAPLYLNPALTGATGQARAGLNYRNQWPAIDANFRTMSAYFDYFLEDYKSGIGAIITSDTEGLAGLRSLSLGLQYSYELQLTDYLGFRPGVQVGIFNRDINFGKLTFGDQYDQNTRAIFGSPHSWNDSTPRFSQNICRHLVRRRIVYQKCLARRIGVALDATQSKS